MTNKILFLVGTIAVPFMVFAATNPAVDLSKVKYPIAPLGNCANKQACRNYCEIPKNMSACLNFAEQNKIMSSEDISRSRLAAAKIIAGKTPGNCGSRRDCNLYCETNIKECLVFVDNKDGVPSAVKNTLKLYTNKESGPGGCVWGKDCDAYCSKEANFEECVRYAESKGLISQEDKEMMGNLPPQVPFVQYPAKYRPALESCARNKLGSRFDDLFKGKIKPTSADDDAINNCISSVFGQ